MHADFGSCSLRFLPGSFFDDVTIDLVALPCAKTTYWVWDPKTDAVVSELKNNSELCFSVPYNLEARPCAAPKNTPVTMVLKNATLGKIRTQKEYIAPFFFWGDDPTTGDILRSTLPLPAGTYWLCTTVDGVEERIRFTKTC
jgi:hypothetical protein